MELRELIKSKDYDFSANEISLAINSLSVDDIDALAYDWRGVWAREKQILPPGNWFVWFICGGRGFGKMIDVNTEIKTLRGWVKMRDIIPGDYVFDENGIPVCVLIAHEPEKKEAYKLYFDTGETIICCEDHLWYTISKLEDKQIRRGKRNKGSVKTTNQIVKSLKYGNRETNHRIPVCGAIRYPVIELPIDPYFLGIWLGDGSSKSSEITCADHEILEKIESVGYKTNNTRKIQYSVDKKPSLRNDINGRFIPNDSVHSKLKSLNLIKNKHIPDVYQNTSEYQRMELLKGLMDSDGYCNDKGWCEFVSIKKQLANDAFELISSLGIKARMYDNESKYYGKLMGRKYRIFFKTDKLVFNLTRKLERQLSATKNQMSRHQNRFIVNAEKVSECEMRCLTVDSDSGLFLIGKSFIPTHNTRTGAETTRIWKNDYPIIHLVGETAADARDVMIEGESGILATSPKDDRPLYEPSKRRITWKNGAIANVFSAEDPDQLRGPHCYKAWADELAKWRYPDAWDQLVLGAQLGDNPQIIVTTTPRPTKLIKDLIAESDTHLTSGTTFENQANLSKKFIEKITSKYEGTRLGNQELLAKILEDVEGALWKMALIESNRVKKAPDLKRIVVAIDPAVTSKETSDETGIVVAGLGVDDKGYVLGDKSGIYTPNGWGKKAINAYYDFEADKVVAEVNNGGELVETILRNLDVSIPYKDVWASRKKITRAEPIHALYEQGRIKHVGILSGLETQMTTWDAKAGDKSPDRVDGLVWAFTELMIKNTNTNVWC